MKRWCIAVAWVGLVACGEDDASGGGTGGASSGGTSASGGSGGTATGGSAGAATGGGAGAGGSAAGAGGTGGSSSTCGAECLSVAGTFNTTAVSFQCNYKVGPDPGGKTFVNVGGEPNLLVICHDSTNTYTFTLSLKGPVGKHTGSDNQANYFKLEAGAKGLSMQQANTTDWNINLTAWDVTGKHAAGTFHIVASDDGNTGLAQYTAWGTIDGKFDVTW